MNFDVRDDRAEEQNESNIHDWKVFTILRLSLTFRGCPEHTEGCLERPKGDRVVQPEDKELVDPL